jgi:FKBP-type peptidyl-prolyl cis-trans isomerase
MKRLLYFISAISILASSCKSSENLASANCDSIYKTRVDSLSSFDQVSYALAYTVASDMQKNGIDTLNFDVFKLAFQDLFIGDTNRLGEELTQKQMIFLGDSMRKMMQEKQLKENGPNMAEGEAFFASLKTNDSIKFTPSGLAYKITREGTGAKPGPADKVTAHYEGRLIDGSIFDSSYPRGNPVEFPLNRVIKGWTEGLQLVGEGGAIELYIPYDLGYGVNGSGNQIPPYATLIFTVELISVATAHDGHNHAPGQPH